MPPAAYEQERQQALSRSGLPTVPSAVAPAASPLESELRARIAELERMMQTQGSIGPGARVEPVPYSSPPPAPVMAQTPPVAQTYPVAPPLAAVTQPLPGYFAVDPTNDAFRLGINYIVYGLTH